MNTYATGWIPAETLNAEKRDADYMLNTMGKRIRTRTIGAWDVTVDPTKGSPSYFENNGSNGGSGGGGLWFEGRRLVDYDGVYELPLTVKAILADLGYVLDWAMR